MIGTTIDWEENFDRLLDERETERPKVELEEGERRKVAVLFLDIQGFSTLSQHLDPEQSRGIAETALRVFANVVKQYGGRIDKLLGDGMMALFGSEHATERDIDQALLTGIECLHRLQDVNERLKSRELPGLNIRIGINYGEVVVGKIAGEHGSETVMGAVVNLASRMESNAPINRILLPLDTYQLALSQYFSTEPREITVKGFDQPIMVVEVWANKKQSGFDRTEFPFVGRTTELHQLCRWRTESPSMIIISGPAGIGKSRLVAEALSDNREPTLVIRPPAAVPISYGLIAALLRQLLRLEGIRLTLADLSTGLERFDCADKDIIDRFAIILGIRNPNSPISKLSGETLFRELVAAVRSFFAKLPLHPGCWVFEDGQWGDEISYQILSDSIDALVAPIWRILLLRDLAEIPLPPRFQKLPELTLSPFSETETRQFLDELIPGCELPPRVFQLWSDRANGSPLVLLELGRLLKARNHLVQDKTGKWKLHGWIEEFTLPESLTGLFRSRFDRLEASQKHWIELASVEGAGFRCEIVEQIGMATKAGPPVWESLVQSGWIYPLQGGFGRFTTPLAQEAAYSHLLKSNREKLHRYAAEAYEQLYPELLDEFLPVLARHWSGANEPEKTLEALVLWRRTAMRRYDTNSAFTAAQKADEYLQHHKIHRQRELKIECKLDQAKLRRLLADHLKAEEKLLECIAGFEDSVNATLRAQVLSELAYLRYDQSRLNEALEQTNAALELCPHECPERIEIKLKKVNMLHALGRAKEGLEIVEECHRNLPADADDTTIARVHLLLSHLYKLDGRYEEARDAFIESAEVSKRQGDLLNMALALAGLADYYCERKEFDRSIKIYHEVIDVFDRIGDKVRSIRIKYGLSGVYIMMKNFSAAEELLHTAAGQATLLKNDLLLQAIRNNLGVLAGMQEKLAEAEAEFLESERICHLIGAKQAQINALTNITQVAALRGCWSEVSRHAEELEARSRESGDRGSILNADLFLVRVMIIQGNPDAAIALLESHSSEVDSHRYSLLLSTIALAKTVAGAPDADEARQIAFKKKVEDDDTGWLLRYEANLLTGTDNKDDIMPEGPFIAERAALIRAKITGDITGLDKALERFIRAGATGFVEECQTLLTRTN